MQTQHFRGVLVALALVLGLTLVGCGSGAKQDSPFAGSYRTVYQMPALSETGEFNFTVAQKGAMSGLFVDTSTGKTMGFSGEIKSDGTFNGVTTDGPNRFATSGIYRRDEDAGDGGNFEQNRNGSRTLGSFVVTNNPPSPIADSAFAGAYSGSYSLNGQSQSEAVSFSVDKRGNVVGSLDSDQGTGLFTGTVNSAGTLTGTVAFPEGIAQFAGTLVDTDNGIPSGNFTLIRGGSSSTGVFKAPVPLPSSNPFIGTYNGSFSIPSQGVSGPVNYTVNPSGNILGSFTKLANGSQSGGEVGTFTGVVAADGTLTGNVAYPSGTVAINGSLVANSGSEPRGNFLQSSNGAEVPGSFSGPINPPNQVGFQGAYRGTYAIPEQQESGNISFTINTTGDLIGFISQSNNTPVGQLSGRVESNGAFDCTVTYATNLDDPYRSPRPFKGRLAQTAVNGQTGLSGDFVMTITTNSATNPPARRDVPGNFELSIGGAEPNSDFRGTYRGGIPALVIETTIPGDTTDADPNNDEDTTETRIVPAEPAIVPRDLPDGSGRVLFTSINTNFSIDLQGDLIGTWGNNTVKGRVTNDGRFTATIHSGPSRIPIVGKLSKQQVPFRYNRQGEIEFSAGVAGNFEIVINGELIVVYFFGPGGFTEN